MLFIILLEAPKLLPAHLPHLLLLLQQVEQLLLVLVPLSIQILQLLVVLLVPTLLITILPTLLLEALLLRLPLLLQLQKVQLLLMSVRMTQAEVQQ